MTTQRTTTTTRIDNADDEALRRLAAYHGRKKTDELRRAVAIHVTQSTLGYLQTPEAAAELGDELEAKQEQVKADLAELIRATYLRPTIEPSGPDLN